MRVRVDNLKLVRDGRTTLSDITLDIPSGHRVAIIGPNGAGKSTLLSTLAGTLSRQRATLTGAVSLTPQTPTTAANPIDVLAAKRGSLAEQLSYMPQSQDLPFAHSALDVVLMGGAHRRGTFGFASAADREAALEALNAVGVSHLVDEPITRLSGGERQRVLFAMQCVQRAPLMLLDEPTSAQDFRGAALMARTLESRAAAGTTVIAAVHDLNLAARAFDAIALLDGGHLRAYDNPEAVLTSAAMQQAYGDGFAVHRVDGAVTVVPHLTAPS